MGSNNDAKKRLHERSEYITFKIQKIVETRESINDFSISEVFQLVQKTNHLSNIISNIKKIFFTSFHG